MEIKILIEKIETSIPDTVNQKERLLKKALLTDLSELKKKEFTSSKKALLNNKIDKLFGDIDFKNINLSEIKNINKKRIELKKFVQKELNVIPEDYYRRMSTYFGILLGALFQMINSEYFKINVYSVVFLILGISIAQTFGYMIDKKIKKQNESVKI